MLHLSKKIRNARLMTRLSQPIVVALVLLLIAQWALYAFLSDTVTDMLYSTAASVTVSISSHVESRMRSIVERIQYAKLNPTIEEDLTDYLIRGGEGSEALTQTRLSATLPLYKVTEPLISSVLLYTPKQTFTGDGIPTVQDFAFTKTSLWQLLQQTEDPLIFADPREDEIFRLRRQVVPVLYRFQVEGYDPECVMVVNLDQQKLCALLVEALPRKDSQVLLLTDTGKVVAASDSALALEVDHNQIHELLNTQETAEVNLNGKSYLAVSTRLDATPWHVLYLHSREQSSILITNIRNIFSLIMVLILGLLLASLHQISNTVTKPLGRLCEHIRTSESKGKLLDFDYPYQDEIGELVCNYNSMAEHIQCLLETHEQTICRLEEEKTRADVEQTLKRKAELRALQAQINPHFLYNTLDSIRWKAEMAGAMDISQMTTALATLFRVGLSRGREIITVEQELSHVESYLKIQEMRYRDRMTYTMDIDPEVRQLYTVKLILQPLVENAIYHGIKESSHSGNVEITGRREGDALKLQVRDNGLGIPPDRLKILQANLEQGLVVTREGYGIFNVNERIRLHFGNQYGLTLESEFDKGTTATVTLPCITISEVEKYVSYNDR